MTAQDFRNSAMGMISKARSHILLSLIHIKSRLSDGESREGGWSDHA
ncbi:MAG: hypothetical protein K8T91_10770 [Planctomycetes bacterium]|nr:hypothetical protein [Planctomycetota bacterium]